MLAWPKVHVKAMMVMLDLMSMIVWKWNNGWSMGQGSSVSLYWLHIEETALNCSSAGSMSQIHISYQCLDLDTRAMTLSLLYDFHSRLSFIITHKPSVSKHNQSWLLSTIVSVWIMVFFNHFWRELKCANKN